MKHLLPLLILIFAFTASHYAQNACAVTLPSTSADIFSATFQQTFSFDVQAPGGCQWQAVSNVSWITITNDTGLGIGKGVGNGKVTYKVEGNNGDSRSGTITVGNKTFTINQSSPCFYNFNPGQPMSVEVPASSGSYYINFSHGLGGSCSEIFTADVPWITTNGHTFFYEANNTGQPRSGIITIQIGNGQVFRFGVYQAAGNSCTYTLSSIPFSIPASGENGTVNVTSQPGCAWTATTNASWITIQNGSGTGSGTVTFKVPANPGEQRSGTISIAGQTIGIHQQTACSFASSSPGMQIFGAEGGTGTIHITTSPTCTWTAYLQAPVPWITITSGTNYTGSGTVTYTVQPNTTSNTRLMSFTIAASAVFVSQAASCTYTLSTTSYNSSASGENGTVSVTTQPGCSWSALSNVLWITTFTNGNNTGNGTVTFSIEANTGAARLGTITIAGQTFTVNQAAALTTPTPTPRRTANDFDGDGKADFSIFRAVFGEWWYQRSSDGGNRAFQFGASTDKIVPADYTGDGKTDIAIFRPSTGEWFILRSEDNSYYAFPFGASGDIPVPADYDGDKKTDTAVYRPSTQVWYILQSSAGLRIEQFGENDAVPVPADYDGNGAVESAYYVPLTGVWKIRYSETNKTTYIFTPAESGKPIPADYNGDGKADMATFFNGLWAVYRSEIGSVRTVQFGQAGDIPALGDYDGDGRTDFAIWRPSTADWWYAASSAGGEVRTARFGISSDIPVPSAYVR